MRLAGIFAAVRNDDVYLVYFNQTTRYHNSELGQYCTSLAWYITVLTGKHQWYSIFNVALYAIQTVLHKKCTGLFNGCTLQGIESVHHECGKPVVSTP